MVFKKGHKSHALRLLGVLLCVIASIGMVAYLMNSSAEQTNKVSFKAAGVKYKKQFTVSQIFSPQDMPTEKNQRKNTSSATLMQNGKSQNSTNKKSLVAEAEQVKNSTNSTLTTAEKQPLASEIMKISSDLQVLSSFNCVMSIPTVLRDYISNMFLHEYGRSHEDFYSQHSIDEKLPLLKQFNINCGIDQNCSTLFQYDKKYGLNTTADNTYQQKEVFYCCPSVQSLTNETISHVCKHAQKVAGKSVFRESKESTFLGRVTELLRYLDI